ncbi:MAG: ABC transporter ATP-binding protein [Thermomicrobiales bacterium]|nr:ABC transporter ATP-binding protein [Thermomicrobiales bacterium]
MPSVNSMIDVNNLVKHYGDVKAVDGITFSVAPGEVFGLLGHNGAGKTTTLRMLTGRALPTSGAASIGGFDVVTHLSDVKPLINLVFEDQNLYERLSGYDNLKFFAELYGAPAARVDELLARFSLTEASSRKLKTYSSGMKQRLLIARSLINAPKVLMLDEPTRGLDPASSREMRTIIRELASTGVSVLLCTHYMEEADELCDRVAFMANGRIVALDTPRELKLRYGEPTARVLLQDRSEHDVSLTSAEDAARVAQWIENGDILTMHSNEGTLEDVFIALAGRPL